MTANLQIRRTLRGHPALLLGGGGPLVLQLVAAVVDVDRPVRELDLIGRLKVGGLLGLQLIAQLLKNVIDLLTMVKIMRAQVYSLSS